MSVFVCPLPEARLTADQFDAVITIEDVDFVDGLRLPASQLVLRFEDVDIEDELGPQAGHVEAALAFARTNVGGRLLVHCKAGQARSPAIVLAIIADRLGPGRETEAVAELLSLRPDDEHKLFGPNLEVLRLADNLLGRDGALVSAWNAVEAGNERLARFRFLREVARERFARPVGSASGL